MGENKTGWLIAAALLGAAGVAGAKASKKKQSQKEQERLERERQAKLEQEQKQREYENSLNRKAEKSYNVLCDVLGGLASSLADWAEPRVEEHKARAKQITKNSSDSELIRLAKCDDNIVREAAKNEIYKRDPYGLRGLRNQI